MLVFLGIAGVLIPRQPTGPASQGATGTDGQTHTVIIVSSAIHSDIALPASELLFEKFDHLALAGFDIDYPGADWIVFGWGSRAFYLNTPTWSALRPGPLLTALTIDRESVMHVMRAGGINENAPRTQRLDLTRDQYDRLLNAIERSFASGPTPSGVTLIEGAGYTPQDAFFEANGWFNALYGCNAWTARVLREAGITTGFWTPLPHSLLWSLRLHN